MGVQRYLKFFVDGQSLSKDTQCDFESIVPNSKNYLIAQFTFPAWMESYAKAAVFSTSKGEYPEPIINGSCMIPYKALTERSFSVQVVCQMAAQTIATNRLVVNQFG